MSTLQRQASRIKDRGNKVITPSQTSDIFPGIKLTECTWYSLLDHEDSVDFIDDIVEDIYKKAMVQIYNVYLENQAISYTSFYIQDILMNIIKWQFLTRDEADKNISENPSWIEDKEATPAVIDSWAEGMLGKLSAAKQEESQSPVGQDNMDSDNFGSSLEELSETVAKIEKAQSNPRRKSSSVKSDGLTSLEVVGERLARPTIRNLPLRRDTNLHSEKSLSPIASVHAIPGKRQTTSTASKKAEPHAVPKEKVPSDVSNQSLKINLDSLSPQRMKTGYVLIAAGTKTAKTTKIHRMISKAAIPAMPGAKDVKEVLYVKCMARQNKNCPPDQPFPHAFTDMVTLSSGVTLKEGQNVKRPQLESSSGGKTITQSGPLIPLVAEGQETGVIIANIVGTVEPTVRCSSKVYLPPLKLPQAHIGCRSPTGSTASTH